MIGKTRGIEKEVNVTAATTALTIATPGADDNTFSTAADATHPLIGIFQFATNTDQPMCRVMVTGISHVKVGTVAVTRGDFITSDVNGCAITAAPTAGVNNFVVGIAMASGAAGQTIPVLLCPGRIQG